MPKREMVICEGGCFTVEWGAASNGECQARDYYDELNTGDRARALALFVRMANVGKIFDTTRFTKETAKLYAFKPQPHRFFCFFVQGRRVVIVTAYRKQGDKVPRREIARAEAVRGQWFERSEVEEDIYGQD